MKLSEAEIELFYKLYRPLLTYTNERINVVKGLHSPDDLRGFPIEEVRKIRDKLYEHPELIESFVAENPAGLSADELRLIKSWRDFVRGSFVIFRYLKNYTVFLDPDEPPKAYGVLALNTTFEEMLGPYLPIMVDAVLLPFSDKIIYDGILSVYSVIFSGSIRRGFNDAYQRAKSMFGIITSLPFAAKRVEQSDADKLRFYLRSKRNREMYREEIEELIEKDPDLLTLYHQEMGKIHARIYGKRLREIGLTEGWFAILEGLIIASGATRDEVERTLQSVLPAEKRKFVYIFRLKGGKGK